MISAAERVARRAGDSPLRGRSEPKGQPMSDARQRKLTGHLNLYWDAVTALRDARGILICGSDEAKGN